MKHSAFIKASAALFSVCAAGFFGWLFFVPPGIAEVEEGLARQTPATIYLDRYGNPAHYETGYDYSFRLPVKLADLPRHVIDITLAVEDRNFFFHRGADFSALLRAAVQSLSAGRIVSGGSTITMQLMNLGRGGTYRSWFRKLRQLRLALFFERKYSKHDILEAYFNYLPFGGKIYGLESAAQYYFGHSAGTLSVEETLLLVGIPQRPNRFRPDWYPQAARRRREIVIRQLRENQYPLPENPAMPRLRSFLLPRWERADNPQYFQLVSGESPIHTAFDPELDQLARAALDAGLAGKNSAPDAALVLLENATGKIRVLIGTRNFHSLRAGQVNAAVARRSPGSALKPFFYAEAVDGGLLTESTKLDDSALSLADYRPENFDGTFHGGVRADTALSSSLNTPAVRILREVGEKRIRAKLSRIGVLRPQSNCVPGRETGLSLALGGEETSLLALSCAYRAFARDGIWEECTFREQPPERKSLRLFTPGSAALIRRALRLRPLPGAGNLPAAWKTGTSSNFRDSWCIAFTPEWTVGVWYGNKDGSPSSDLVGITLAAPTAGALLRALYKENPPGEFSDLPHLAWIRLCGRTGLRASPDCPEKTTGIAAKNVPLQLCRQCARPLVKHPGETRSRLRILLPAPGEYHVEETSGQKFRMELRSVPPRAHWYWNGRYLGELNSGVFREFPKGEHRLNCWVPGTEGAEVKFCVR